MIVYFDGQKLTGTIDGLKNSVFTELIENEDGAKVRSFSSELTFYDDGYLIIRDKLINDPNGKNNKVKVRILDDCCSDELLFEGIIRGDMIDWCEGDCFVTATLVQEDAETKIIDCLKTTLVFDNRLGFQTLFPHPRMSYCNEMRPGIFQEIILIYGLLFNAILILWIPIIAVISFIIKIVCAIPFVKCSDELKDGILDNYQEGVRRMNDNLIGCSRKHPSPLVRNYILNGCAICGVKFKSTIFNRKGSDYYNTVYYNNPVEKGTKDSSINFIFQNRPIKTIELFLNDLKIPFNAKWEVIGDTLYFERKDFFDDSEEWLNYDLLKAGGQIVEEPCYKYSTGPVNAAVNFEYQRDAVDWVGNEALPFYNDIVGQNEPFSDTQSGIKEVQIPFGVPRFRDDLIDKDILGIFSGFPVLKQAINGSNGYLIQNNGTNFLPKLLIWDGKNIFDGKVIEVPVTTEEEKTIVKAFNKYPIKRVGYNFWYQFNELGVDKNTVYPADQKNMAMYGRFHTIDHPKVSTYRGVDYTLTIKYDCDLYRERSLYKSITLPIGKGSISKLEITPDKQHIKITGKV